MSASPSLGFLSRVNPALVRVCAHGGRQVGRERGVGQDRVMQQPRQLLAYVGLGRRERGPAVIAVSMLTR
ncbi:hypothetical protein [Streptomyces sp. NPDC059761]|uniref:hypothetical protein n=1 Tax=Streptomyces sp. NPDC059761 TaxID=3346937 RepID=UPI003663377B